MLESELRFYLKTHLKNPTLDFELSDEENKELIEYLNQTCKDDCLEDAQNKLKIKQIFKEYFEDIGYILFKMNNNKIRIKVFPYKIEPKDSVNLHALVDLIEENEELIEFNYKGKENQASLPLKLKNKLFDFVNNIDNEEINKKELIRYAVGQYFDLHESDIVLIRSEQIFIKKFEGKHRREVKEHEKNTVANRYNGIEEEELKAFDEEFFSQEDNKDFFYFVAKTYVEIYLLENRIDNFTYEKNVFSDIHALVMEHLIDKFDHNDDFLKGFSGYIFRIHFKEVFEHIASLLLEQITISNEYVIEFLKYYSSNIIVLEGKKYKVPELLTEDGLKWNVVSMLSIVKVYIRTKFSAEELKKEIAELSKKVKTFYIGKHSPVEYQSILAKEKEKLREKIANDEKKLEGLLESFETTKSADRKISLKHNIHDTKTTIAKNKEEKVKLESKNVQQHVISKYTTLRKELDTMVRQLQRDEKILEQNKDSYLSIRNTLAKALSSKKVLVGQ